jgi:hypothetical protein
MASPIAKHAVCAKAMSRKINGFAALSHALDQQCDGFASPLDIQQDKP